MNNFFQRSLTSLGIVVVVIVCVWSGPYSFLLLCLLIDGVTLLEFYHLAEKLNVKVKKSLGLVLSISLLISTFLLTNNLFDWQIVLVSIPFAAIIFIIQLYSKSPIQRLAFTFLGITWITLPLVFFISTAFLPFWAGMYQRNIILGYFFILWANDTGAYLFGSVIGKRKLFPSVSPKKTWEGSAGGAITALMVGYFVSHYFEEITSLSWLVIAALIIVFGTFGDLLKSVLKRSVNVKDSGTLLPGHGGFFDRFDSLIGSAPFVFAYLALILNT